MRKERIGKIGYRICAVLAAAVSLWCMGDNLWPVVKENGTAWALRAAGLQAATSQEVPQAEASPAPQKGGRKRNGVGSNIAPHGDTCARTGGNRHGAARTAGADT